MAETDEKKDGKKKGKITATAWREARKLLWQHRGTMAIGILLMVVNRLAGLVLPGSSKYLIDRVLPSDKNPAGDAHMLVPLALAVGAATVVQALTSFGLSQVISIAGQRAITQMRRRVQEHVTRLPVRFFDATQSGILIARIMNDAEGIRNLVGTGIIQLVGGVMTSIIALGVLLYLNWKLTFGIFLILAVFGGVMAAGFNRLRPILRSDAALG